MSQSNTAAQQLYDLLVTRDFKPSALDSIGKPADNPADAKIISLDYKTDQNDYGAVVMVFDGENNLDIYFGDNMGRTMEGDDRNDWYDFLHTVRMLAKRNLLTFGLKNLSRLKYNMKTMAAIKESVFESYYGTRKVSYKDQPQHTRLLIKHSRDLEEGDARYRNIDSIYVETVEGERFKVPSRSLMHGRMLARHVAEGGNPYDSFGQHINEIVDEMRTLAHFVRVSRHKNYDGAAAHMIESAVKHYSDLKTKAKKLISRRGYHEAKNQFDPAVITGTNEAVETIRELFVQQSLDPRIEQALPVLAKLQETPLKEADMFETWASQILEGTWALPDTPKARKELQDLMSKPLTVGPDAMNATEQLYDLVGDDELYDIFQRIAKKDPDADVWEDDDVVEKLKELGIEIPDSNEPESELESEPESEPKPESEPAPAQPDTTSKVPNAPAPPPAAPAPPPAPPPAAPPQTPTVEESTCNMTADGAWCPVHGMKECSIHENTDLQRLRVLASFY